WRRRCAVRVIPRRSRAASSVSASSDALGTVAKSGGLEGIVVITNYPSKSPSAGGSAPRPLAELRELAPGPRVRNLLRGEPASPGGGDPVDHVPERLDSVGVRVDADRRPGLGRQPRVALGEVPPVRVAIDLEHRAGAGSGLGDALHVD